MEKFIASDPRQPLLLPVDLREWVPSDDLSHFVLEAVARVPMDRFRVNTRGSGSVFPTSHVYYDVEIPPFVIDWRFEAYTKKHFYIAVAARLKYCDANRSLHWTQLGVAKIFSETDLTVRHSTASLHPGEPDHRDCQDSGPQEP